MIVIIKYKNQEYRCFFRPFQAPGRLAYRLLQTLDNSSMKSACKDGCYTIPAENLKIVMDAISEAISENNS